MSELDTIPQIIQVYQDLVQSQQSTFEQLLQSQQSNFHLLLAVFGVLIILFIGTSWFFNVRIAREQLRSETKKIFDETNKLINDFKEEFEYSKNYLLAETQRSILIGIKGNTPEDIVNRLAYATGCIEHYKLVNIGRSVKIFVNQTLIELKSAKGIKDKFNKAFKELEYDYNEILRKIDFILGELHEEKKEIQQLIEELKKED